MYFNKVILLGSIASDIIYTSSSGDGVSTLFLATNRKWKDRAGVKKEQSTYHKVVFFGQMAELIKTMGKRGEHLMVEGRLQHREYEDIDRVKRKDIIVVCEKFILGSEKFEKDKVEINEDLINKQLEEWDI